jgi:hypothetical protein
MRRFAALLFLFLLTIAVYWKILLTDQYTWLSGADIVTQVLPWLQYQASEVQAGRLPLWSPFEWAGQPIPGQGQPGTFAPLNWLLFLAPLKRGWLRMSSLHWYFALLHFVAAINAYALARSLRLRRSAAILSACGFAFTGLMAQFDWPQMLQGALWAPLVFLFLFRWLRSEDPLRSACLAGFTLGLCWLSGHHQLPLWTSLAAAGILLFHFLTRCFSDKLRMLKPGVGFGVFFAATAAAFLLPAWEYGHRALRWMGQTDPGGWDVKVPYSVHAEYSLSFFSLISIVIPTFEKHVSLAAGAVLVLLGVIGLRWWGERREVRILAVVGGLTLVAGMGGGTLLHGLLYSLVPMVEKARVPATLGSLFNLCLAILAGFGAERLASAIEDAAFLRRLRQGALAFAALMLLVVSVQLMQRGSDTLTNDLLLLPALAAAAFTFLLQPQVPHRGWWLLAIFFFEMGAHPTRLLTNRHTSGGHFRVDSIHRLAPFVEALRGEEKPLRLHIPSTDETMGNHGDYFGVETMDNMLASISANIFRLEHFTTRGMQRFAITHVIAAQAPEGAQPWQLMLCDGALCLYRNPELPARTRSSHTTFQAQNHEELMKLWNRLPAEDNAVVTGATPKLETCAGTDQIRELQRRPSHVVIRANMACRGLVWTADTAWPGWHVYIDGQRSHDTHSVFHAFRSVETPAGTHLIEWRYEPTSVYAGLALTMLAICGAGLLLWGRPAARFRNPLQQ